MLVHEKPSLPPNNTPKQAEKCPLTLAPYEIEF